MLRPPPPAGLRVAMKAIVVRVDYGGAAPYPDRRAAVAALARFVVADGRIGPIVVDTGDGIEAFWPFGRELPVGRWRRAARALAAACRRHGLAAQHHLTVDPNSLWHTPDTHNFVRVLDWGHYVDPRGRKP
jgi:hypothetical protein